VFVANLQGTSCLAGSGQSLLIKERWLWVAGL